MPNFSEHGSLGSEGRGLPRTSSSSLLSRVASSAEDDAVGAVRTRVMNSSFRKSKHKVWHMNG